MPDPTDALTSLAQGAAPSPGGSPGPTPSQPPQGSGAPMFDQKTMLMMLLSFLAGGGFERTVGTMQKITGKSGAHNQMAGQGNPQRPHQPTGNAQAGQPQLPPQILQLLAALSKQQGNAQQ